MEVTGRKQPGKGSKGTLPQGRASVGPQGWKKREMFLELGKSPVGWPLTVSRISPFPHNSLWAQYLRMRSSDAAEVLCKEVRKRRATVLCFCLEL